VSVTVSFEIDIENATFLILVTDQQEQKEISMEMTRVASEDKTMHNWVRG
jgi:hypothetical protein